MNEERAPSVWERVFRGTGFCALAVLLYVASIGPVILLLPDKTEEEDPYPVARKIYRPLRWLVENSPAGKPIEWYAEWFTKMRKR